jgi:DNA-binding transcriptional regulator YiaG
MSTRQQQADSTNIQDASRVLDEAAVMVLDRLAVEGGHATRALLFERCKAAFWGRMVNAAARRSGYDGHDDVDLERFGKEQLFDEAVDRLLGLQVIVIWDDEGDLLALHPTHRVPIRVGGPNYIPGTEFWRNQREQALTDLRTQLIQLRDNSFDASLTKAAALFAQQIRRGQLADDAREEALTSLIALADLLLQPARLAQLLGLPEKEIVRLWQHRMSPVAEPVTTGRGGRRRPPGEARRIIAAVASDPVEVVVEPVGISDDAAQPAFGGEQTPAESTNGAENSIDGATLRRERESRGLTKTALAKLVAVSDSTLGTWERGTRPITPFYARQLHAFFASHPVSNVDLDG